MLVMLRFRFILIIALGTLLLTALLAAGAFCQVEAGNEPVESQLGEGAWYTAPDGTTVVFPDTAKIPLRYLDGQALIQYPYITRILTNRENPVVGLGWHPGGDKQATAGGDLQGSQPPGAFTAADGALLSDQCHALRRHGRLARFTRGAAPAVRGPRPAAPYRPAVRFP